MTIGKNIQQFDANLPGHQPTYDKGDWTGLKLICLEYYVPTYLNILGNMNKRVAYVDFFSGPGLDLIGNSKVPLPGSPLIAVEHHGTRRRFDLHVHADTNESFIDALRSRLAAYRKASDPVAPSSDQVDIDVRDANRLARDLPTILANHSIEHSLLFIDPEGLEMRWDSLEYLAENCRYSDWIILFPSAGLNRLMGKSDDKTWRLITDFLGPGSGRLRDNWSEELAITIYRKNLADIGKNISTEIRVKGEGSFHYHLIPAVRTTRGASPWFAKCFEPAKKRIEGLGGSVLGLVMEQIEGRMGVL